MKINEIFYSLQGEGKLVGLPTIFIRTTGCNLRCAYCDTSYAYHQGTEMSNDEIIQSLKKWNCKRICITGGEPMIQENLFSFLKNLSKNNYEISIETNGSHDIRHLTSLENLLISLDIKCPTSGMHQKMHFENIHFLRPSDQLKFVISTKTDFNYALSSITKYKPQCQIVMQSSKEDIQQLAEWILTSNQDIRFGIQLHKLIWGNKKGV
jgi:7-carboxy-7-deazaguanine synthase